MATGEESEAVIGNAVMATPETADWVPGLVTPTVFEMPQLKVVEPLPPSLSLAVTVTL